MPRNTQARRPSRRETQHQHESVHDDDVDHDTMDVDGATLGADPVVNTLVRNMVRYVLSAEYSRTPIRRDAIKDKILGPEHARKFRLVFSQVQEQLESKFCMRMVELPAREPGQNMSLAERKKKTASQAQTAKSTNTWILQSTLPRAFRSPAILPPANIPTSSHEAAYVGLYTWVIALITLGGGEMTQSVLDRYLQRMNANVNTPIGKTADVLVKMQRQGYLDRHVNKDNDNELSYVVGPRGKVEVPKESLAEVIRKIYGDDRPDDFEERLAISLDLAPPPVTEGDEMEE